MDSAATKSVLFVSGGSEAVPAIRLARDMGLHVVVADGSKTAPGFAHAHGQIHASTYDVEAVVQAAERYHHDVRKLDGVICVAADVPLTVAHVATHLGLPGISKESGQLASDKLLMKERFARDGVRIPWFSEVKSPTDVQRILKERGRDLVLKPVDSRGARGVTRITRRSDMAAAFAMAKEYSPTGRVMVEDYIPGPQLSTESIVVRGSAHTIGYSDRNYEHLETYAPYFIENGGTLPSDLSDDVLRAVDVLVQQAAVSMGIRDGVVKGDIVIDAGEPRVIELAARLSGGYFCTHQIPLSTGVPFVECAIRQAIGETISDDMLKSRQKRGVAQRFVFAQPGVVQSVLVDDWVHKDPHIALCELRVKEGDVVHPVTNHTVRPGVVIATADTRNDAVKLAERAVQAIRITTSPIN